MITFPSFTCLGSKDKVLKDQFLRAVETQFSLCDDFLPQFAMANDLGRQFSDAWFAARQVIDFGRRAAKPDSPNPSRASEAMIRANHRGKIDVL